MLNADDILLMHYINGRTHDEINQYGAWLNHASVDSEAMLKKLLEQHVIYLDHSLPATLKQLTIPQLKHILRTYGIKLSGNKPDLIRRINNHSHIIDTAGLNLKGVYLVTDEYRELFNRTAFIDYFHFNGHISIKAAYSFYQQHPALSSSEIITEMLKENIRTEIHSENKYTAVKSHLLLSAYYRDKLKDAESYVYHLNCFSMLVVLTYIQRCGVERVPDDIILDHYTIDQYKQLIHRFHLHPNTLYIKLISDAGTLPYDIPDIKTAARLITEMIIRENNTHR